MPKFLVEPLAGAAGTNLSALPTGATKHAGAAPNLVLSNANPRRLRGGSNQTARYVYPQEPESADYDADGSTTRLTGLGEWGLMLRCDPLVNTHYFLGYVQSAGAWQIQRVVNNGAPAVLRSVAQSWANTQTRQWRFRVRGTGPVRLEILDARNGPAAVVASVEDAAADRITAAGRVGVRLNAGTTSQFDSRGYHLNSFSAAGLPPAPLPVTAKPPKGPLATEIDAITHADPREQARLQHARRREITLQEWEAAAPGPWQATVGGTTYTITLERGPTLVGGAYLETRLAVSPAPPPGFDPDHWFHATAMGVRDGTVREAPDRNGDPVYLRNYREDPVASFRNVVTRAALGYLLRRPG